MTGHKQAKDSIVKMSFNLWKVAFRVAEGRAKRGTRCKLYKEAGKWHVEAN